VQGAGLSPGAQNTLVVLKEALPAARGERLRIGRYRNLILEPLKFSRKAAPSTSARSARFPLPEIEVCRHRQWASRTRADAALRGFFRMHVRRRRPNSRRGDQGSRSRKR